MHKHKPKRQWVRISGVRCRVKICRSCWVILPYEYELETHIARRVSDLRIQAAMKRSRKLKTFRNQADEERERLERLEDMKIEEMVRESRVDAVLYDLGIRRRNLDG